MRTGKPKLLILTCKGGYGHLAASTLLEQTLTDFEIKVCNPFEEIFSHYDWFLKLSRGKVDGEMFYNILLKRNWIRLANFMCGYAALFYMRRIREGLILRFTNLLDKERPDFIISLAPWFNLAVSKAAQARNIPFLIVTLDADIWHWMGDMNECTHPNYRITIATASQRLLSQLRTEQIPLERVETVGFQLRPEFLESKNLDVIRAEWDIPSDRPTVMVMMGSAGSKQLLLYTRHLFRLAKDLHLLLCVGTNMDIVADIEGLPKDPRISYTIVPFTDRVSDLMAVSNLLITKPGPNTCNEALHMGLPILMDGMGPCLSWENGTIDLVVEAKRGDVAHRISDLPLLLDKYLALGRTENCSKQSVTPFTDCIRTLIQEMLQPDNAAVPSRGN